MERDWNHGTLGDFVSLQRGHDLTESERRLGSIPVFGSAGLNGFHDTALAPGPGVVVGRSGASFGKVHYCPSDYWPHNTALYVTNFKNNEPRFAYYLLSALDFSRYNSGSAQPSLNRNYIYSIPISFPGKEEQQAIAHILGTLDDKIELNRRRNRTLEAMARALFKSWFVDFDPVKAQTAGQAPAGLKPEIAALFPDSFENSELGEIPKGWRVGTVGDITEVNGWTLGKRDALDQIEYVEISQVMRGEVATITKYPRGTEPGRARRRLRHGDTAISTVRPDRGAYFLSIEPSPTLIASTGFAILTANGGHWAFLHVLATRKAFGDELGRLADGGAYPAVRPEVITARPVIIPPDEVVVAFEKIAQPMFLWAEKARRESCTLAALRDVLLPNLISGDLRVPETERIVGRMV